MGQTTAAIRATKKFPLVGTKPARKRMKVTDEAVQTDLVDAVEAS